MTKRTERTGDPAPVAVPWAQPQTEQVPAVQTQAPEQTDAALEQATAEFEALGDDAMVPTFTPDLGEKADATATPDEFAERIRSAFSGEPIKQSSPFAPKPKPAPEPEAEIFDLGDAPSWGELVAFVQRHGDVIIQVRYPAPRGVAIDTIYRGVTVITHPTCELRHVKLGWIAWKDAQYERA
jgi:hypothetical protein